MIASPAGSHEPEATTIGRYILRDRLAAGATGYVYAADDVEGQRMVAVKVLAAELEDEPETRERFYREASIMTRISHPNIVRVLEIGDDHGRPFIAMELLRGKALADHLRAAPDLTLRDRLDLIVQLYSGLEAAHAVGAVHRDIKPGNIIVTPDGQLKILDFGLARLTSSTLTASGVVVGSPAYMSPEQAEGRRVDQRSDIFSAAAVAYLILSGHAPFEAKTLPLVLQAILSDPPPPLSPDKAPDLLVRVLWKALEKSPEARYQAAADVVRDLQRVITRVVQS